MARRGRLHLWTRTVIEIAVSWSKGKMLCGVLATFDGSHCFVMTVDITEPSVRGRSREQVEGDIFGMRVKSVSSGGHQVLLRVRLSQQG